MHGRQTQDAPSRTRQTWTTKRIVNPTASLSTSRTAETGRIARNKKLRQALAARRRRRNRVPRKTLTTATKDMSSRATRSARATTQKVGRYPIRSRKQPASSSHTWPTSWPSWGTITPTKVRPENTRAATYSARGPSGRTRRIRAAPTWAT